MKKILIALLVALVAVTSVFAADAPAINAESTNSRIVREPFYPMTPKVMGMGGSGIAKVGRTDSFFLNPAGLAMRDGVKFQMSIPYADVTLYNIYNYLKPGEDGGPSVFETVTEMINAGGEVDPVKIAESALAVLTPGKNKIATVNAGVSFIGGGFGLGVHARANVHDWGAKGGGLDSKLFAEVEAAVTMGYAHRIDLGPFSIDLGANLRFNGLMYSDMLGATDALKAFPKQGAEPAAEEENPVEAVFGTLPLAGGWQFGADVGMNFNMPFGFSLGVVGRNFGTPYYMTVYDNYKGLVDDPAGWITTDSAFTMESPWSLDFGFGWKVKNVFLTPTIEVDFVDGIGLFRDVEKLKEGRTWLSHLRAGVDLRLLNFLDVRGGLNQGYWSLGAGLDLGIIKVDAAYYWTEMGETLGDKNVDALQVRVNIGFDR